MQRPIQQQFDFLRESLKNLRATGSILPSSAALCKRIAEKIDPARAGIVVELGPGDGVITRYILERLRPDARLLIFEINETFVIHLQNSFNDPRLAIIHDSAENMEKHFKAMGIAEVDYIISGIPFVSLPESFVINITRLCRHWLKAGGRFVQFHYSPVLLRRYKQVFGNIDVDFVAWNVPPALIISCAKT